MQNVILNLPIDNGMLFHLYNAIGLDPSNCSQFVLDMMPIFACIVLGLFFIGCLCVFKWFYRLMKW